MLKDSKIEEFEYISIVKLLILKLSSEQSKNDISFEKYKIHRKSLNIVIKLVFICTNPYCSTTVVQ